ncbi:MAG TPA: Na+/H+ antiporter NhaA, partial [Phenylobacterium sp.]|nr:Na+/H+ antiporter NhaA [Phenylobacterium sp.]
MRFSPICSAEGRLPALAAIGGIAIPALIFYGINIDSPQNINGWAIPAATDIAFAI